ncbi:uncharacterized protein si:ch211-183d21.1 isoform X2 [Hypomesus transpacificus]|nr:uncharacterized protein si:ch211-183d21.1 isoform X2 [Hypomesus transpacificus]
MVLSLSFPVVTVWVSVSLVVLQVKGESCLIISEINADNPKLDTTEFVELYHTSGQRASLDGYTLVFYNGNGNVAYKVLDLKGHSTDDRGFFLVGSVDIQPKPAILLPPNTVQNGPDAIALYHTSAARYSEKMNVTAVGLVDAAVYTSWRSGGSPKVLADILTPGNEAFVEDEGYNEGDESLERCLLSWDHWGFRMAAPSPGQRNNCSTLVYPADTSVINELKLGGGLVDGYVEIQMLSSGSLALVVLDGRTDRVSMSVDVDVSRKGIVTVVVGKNNMKGDDSGAVALYRGSVADFPAGSALSRTEVPLDAFVFAGPGSPPSDDLVETLVPNTEPYQLSSRFREGGFPLSRCGTASETRNPGLFWEAPPTPGLPNQCPWPKICPHDSVVPVGTDMPPDLPPWARQDFLISEVNSDTPGSAEDSEFVELFHPSARRASLEGLWLLLFSGHNSKPYREISLSGHYTNAHGFFLVGSDKMVPAPSVRLPPNTIQNGPDAVALYRSPYGPPSAGQTGIPTRGLLDAVVYRLRGSDKECQELSDVLTPGQLPLLEDPEALAGDEGLSRCGSLQPADLSAFTVAVPTPLKDNACPIPPPPPEGLVISEVASARWTNHSQQKAFVELFGPPLTALKGLYLTVFEQDHTWTVMALPLTGFTNLNGFYLVGNVTGADQAFPDGATVPVRGAVVLCYGSLSVCRAGTSLSNSSLRDTLVFSDSPPLLSSVSASRGQQVMPALRSVEDGPVSLSRCSCCDVRSASSWTSSSPTPHLTNLCPSPAYSSAIDLCLGPLSSDWQEHSGNCSGLIQGSRVMEVAGYLEQRCDCGISALYLQGANFSCVAGWLRVRGNIQALSTHQRALILQMSHTQPSPVQGDVCSSPSMGRHMSPESTLGLQIGLVAGVLLLLGLGAALFTFLYRRRRPLDYYSMELNEHGEGLSEL